MCRYESYGRAIRPTSAGQWNEGSFAPRWFRTFLLGEIRIDRQLSTCPTCPSRWAKTSMPRAGLLPRGAVRGVLIVVIGPA